MKRSLIVLCFSFIALAASAQCKLFFISSEDNLPVPGVKVVFQTADGRLSAVANEKGELIIPEHFSLSESGLEAVALGFEPLRFKSSCDQKVLLFPATDELNPVVVTDQMGASDVKNATYKVSVISAERIRQLGAQDLRDVLRQELNMRISQDQVLGPALTFKGLSGEHIKFLIDGVPIIGRLNGNVDLSQINVNDIERIEIIDGPMSSQFGSNALAATINFITKKGGKDKERIVLRSYNESAGNFNQEIQYNRRLWKNGFLNASFTRNDFNGWNPGESFEENFKRGRADSSRVKLWSPREQYVGRMTYGGNYNKWSWNARSEWYSDLIVRRGAPRRPFNESAFDDHYKTTRIDQSLTSSVQISERWSGQATLGYNYFERRKNTFVTDLTGISQELSGTPGAQDTTVFINSLGRFTGLYTAKDGGFKSLFGLEGNNEFSSGERLADAPSLTDVAVFAEAEYPISKTLRVRGAMRYGYNSIFDVPVVPALHVVYSKNNHTVKSSYAAGFRAPSLKEMYFDFVDINHNIVGNINLKSEDSRTFQASYTFNKTMLGTLMGLEFSVFDNQISNLIALAQVSDLQFSYINIGLFKSRGINTLASFVGRRWTVRAGYSYTTRTSNLLNGELLPWSETSEVNGTASWRINKRFSIHSFAKWTGKNPAFVFDESGELVERYMAAFTLWDANVAYNSLNDRIQFSVGVKNLLNISNVRSGIQNQGVHSSGGFDTPVAMGRLYFIQCIIQWRKN